MRRPHKGQTVPHPSILRDAVIELRTVDYKSNKGLSLRSNLDDVSYKDDQERLHALLGTRPALLPNAVTYGEREEKPQVLAEPLEARAHFKGASSQTWWGRAQRPSHGYA